jgi:hypothetical protein
MPLGMSLGAAFRAFAQSMRWQLLLTRYLGLEEFDQVLGCDSLTTSFKLLWTGRLKGRVVPSHIQSYSAVGLLLNFGL